MTPKAELRTTQGSARPARGGSEAPAPRGGGSGAARFASETGLVANGSRDAAHP